MVSEGLIGPSIGPDIPIPSRKNMEEVCDSFAATNSLSTDHTPEKLSNIRAYILSIFNDEQRQIDSEFAAIVRQVLDGATTQRLLYAFVLSDKCKSRRGVGKPLVKPGVRSRRAQKSEVYKFLKRSYKYNPRTVAKKVLNGTSSYDDLSRKEVFMADDFVKAWKPIFEQSNKGCTIPALDIQEVRWELMDSIQISEVSSSIKKTKNSTPGPNG